ncbi:VanZ family protein [Microbacterium sp. NPDC055357]
MDEQVILGILAIFIGAAVGFVFFVPFVAISYRRRGGLSFGRFVLWAAALVYFWAIWTYTLLPLPDPDTIRCAGVNLDLFQFVDDVRGAMRRPGNTLTDPAVLQLLLNVLLFTPLGFFIRVLGGRGILIAFVVGLGLSAFIETTQLTGVWGVYPCAYRVFDVDDMLTNTTGAVLGSVLSLVVPKRYRGAHRATDAALPHPVTRGRRFVAIVCDVVGFGLLYFTVAITTQLVLEFTGQREALLAGHVASVTATCAAAAIWLIVIVGTGRSIGDLAVQLRYGGGRLPALVARPLRWVGGVSGAALLGLLPMPWNLASAVFVLLSLLVFFTTASGRGLPGLLSGMRLADAREDAGAASRPAAAPRSTSP